MAQAILQSDPTLIRKVKKLGAKNIGVCFNCGNCTAICPLSSESSNFPRKLITYTQLGLEKKLLESPDIWLCNSCGECSKTCPRQADPTETVMALRRFAISKYVPTPLSLKIYESRYFAILFMAIAALVPISLIASLSGPTNLQITKMFTFLPEFWIHNIGIAVGIVVFGAVLFGLAREYLMISKGIPTKHLEGERKSPWFKELITTVFKESLVQYRLSKCDDSVPTWKDRLNTRWFTHMTMVWGFLGLLVSTMLRFVAFPTNGQTVPITDPIRLLGTISGLLLIYGASRTILNRLKRADIATTHSYFTDWVFLTLLLLSGLTGFILEAADYTGPPLVVYWALAVHLIVVFELLIMAPFSKFAHALYRPLAIWVSRTRHYI
jgi:quinone-modifying oxidoreductase, subunit QmoC